MRKRPGPKERKRSPRVKSAAELEVARLREKLKPIGVRIPGRVMVNPALLGPNNSYGEPDFIKRGYYLDSPFRCKDCGKDQLWTATQQKWWYEIAHGDVWTTAIRCRPCRRKERVRKQEAEKVRREGIEKKLSQKGLRVR